MKSIFYRDFRREELIHGPIVYLIPSSIPDTENSDSTTISEIGDETKRTNPVSGNLKILNYVEKKRGKVGVEPKERENIFWSKRRRLLPRRHTPTPTSTQMSLRILM